MGAGGEEGELGESDGTLPVAAWLKRTEAKQNKTTERGHVKDDLQ